MQISYSMLVRGAGMMPGDRDYRQAGDESGGNAGGGGGGLCCL